MTTRGVCAAICAVVTGMATLSWAQVPGPNNAITDVPGIKVGHFTANQTGTTVILAGDSNGQGVAGSITQRGGSPARGRRTSSSPKIWCRSSTRSR